MIRRPPRSTLSSSSAASDVYKRQVQVRGVEEQCKGRESLAIRIAGLSKQCLSSRDIVVLEVRTTHFAEITARKCVRNTVGNHTQRGSFSTFRDGLRDLPTIDCECQSPAHADVVEWLLGRVEHIQVCRKAWKDLYIAGGDQLRQLRAGYARRGVQLTALIHRKSSRTILDHEERDLGQLDIVLVPVRRVLDEDHLVHM